MEEKGGLILALTDWRTIVLGTAIMAVIVYAAVQSLRMIFLYHSGGTNVVLEAVGIVILSYLLVIAPGIGYGIFTSIMEVYENGFRVHHPLGIKKRSIPEKTILLSLRYFHNFESIQSVYLSMENPKRPALIVTNSRGSFMILKGRRSLDFYRALYQAHREYQIKSALSRTISFTPTARQF